MKKHHPQNTNQQPRNSEHHVNFSVSLLMRSVFWVMSRWFLVAFLSFLLIALASIFMTIAPYDSSGLLLHAMSLLLLPLNILGNGTINSAADLIVLFVFWSVVFSLLSKLLNLLLRKRLHFDDKNSAIKKLYVFSYIGMFIVEVFFAAEGSGRASSAFLTLGLFAIGYIFLWFYLLTQNSIKNYTPENMTKVSHR